jgi:uncharacterized protein
MTAPLRTTEHDAELDRGPRAGGRMRLCVATRTVRPITELIRFVVGPDDAAVPDIKGKLPGRGVWVTATQETIEDAVRRRVFNRGFKRDVRLPVDLAELTERLLQRAALDALAIAAKSGLLAAGFAQTAAALEREDAAALLHAAEASADGVRKLNSIARQRKKALPVIEFLTAAQLDLALNRPNVVHAALLAGPACDTFLSRVRRLERYRTGGAGDAGNRTGEGATP